MGNDRNPLVYWGNKSKKVVDGPLTAGGVPTPGIVSALNIPKTGVHTAPSPSQCPGVVRLHAFTTTPVLFYVEDGYFKGWGFAQK